MRARMDEAANIPRYGIGGSVLCLAAVLVCAHHPLGLPMLGVLVGLAQWIDFRRAGLGSSWILATGSGWLGALVVMAVVGRWSPTLAVLLAGALLGAAQHQALRRVAWPGRIALMTAGGFVLSWTLLLLLDHRGARLPLEADEFAYVGILRAHHVGALVAGLPLAILGALGLGQGGREPIGPPSGRRLAAAGAILIVTLSLGVVWHLATTPREPLQAQIMDDPLHVEPRHVEVTPWFREQGVSATIHRFEVGEGVSLFAYLLRPSALPSEVEAGALVLFLPGSGAQSVQGFARRKLAPLVRERGVTLATLDRPGVEPAEQGSPEPTALFHAYDYKQARVVAARAWLDHLVDEHGPFASIGVIGHSEGVDVAARLVREDPRVAAAVLLGGGGYNAADEIRVGLHELLHTGSPAIDGVVERLVDLYVWRHARRILADPTPDRRLLGLSFRRWASYIASAPIDDLLAARHARFLSIHGERDANVPVEAARAVERRFRAAGRTEHTLQVRPQLDHSFRDGEGRDHLPEVLLAALDWILDRRSGDSPLPMDEVTDQR
jgi:pimeloyl-ACP methyl ester carboxylesterase